MIVETKKFFLVELKLNANDVFAINSGNQVCLAHDVEDIIRDYKGEPLNLQFLVSLVDPSEKLEIVPNKDFACFRSGV